jgi:hypothetical protein
VVNKLGVLKVSQQVVPKAFGARSENYELLKNHNHFTFIWLSDDLKCVGHRKNIYIFFKYSLCLPGAALPSHPQLRVWSLES